MPRTAARSLLSAFVAAVALAGCGPPQAEISEPAQESATDPSAPHPNPPPQTGELPPQQEPAGEGGEAGGGQTSVTPVTPSEFKNVLAGLKGKAVLVDYWATWCVPCREQFPHTVALSEKYPAEDLAVLAVSMDETDGETLESVRRFLAKQGGRITPYVSAEGGVESAFSGFEIAGGAVPHYKVFGRDGDLVAAFGGDPATPTKPEDIDAAVEKAVAQ